MCLKADVLGYVDIYVVGGQDLSRPCNLVARFISSLCIVAQLLATEEIRTKTEKYPHEGYAMSAKASTVRCNAEETKL